MPTQQNKESKYTKPETGMMVYARTTYSYFYGRVISSLGKQWGHPGEMFLVLNFKTGEEESVCEYSLERVSFSGSILASILKSKTEILWENP